MESRRVNWSLWIGLLLSIVAFFSYVFVFVRWPITRDVPWVNFILVAIALVLIVKGIRRAFVEGTTARRVIAILVGGLGALVGIGFVLGVTIGTRQIPTSTGAPAIGAKAPELALPDTSRKVVALSQLLAEPGSRGVLLVFYRGYW
jgi:hypothetical protein